MLFRGHIFLDSKILLTYAFLFCLWSTFLNFEDWFWIANISMMFLSRKDNGWKFSMCSIGYNEPNLFCPHLRKKVKNQHQWKRSDLLYKGTLSHLLGAITQDSLCNGFIFPVPLPPDFQKTKQFVEGKQCFTIKWMSNVSLLYPSASRSRQFPSILSLLRILFSFLDHDMIEQSRVCPCVALV